MIQHTIEKVLESDLFELVVVSTDDIEIASISQRVGAQVPFLRRPILAHDKAPTAPVIRDVLRRMEETGVHFDYCCCIYPCVPMLEIDDLISGFEKLRDSPQAEFCYSIAKYEHPIQRAMRKSDNGFMKFLDPEYELTPTQKLETTYHDAGQFYWGKASAWTSGKKMHSDSSLGLILPTWRAIDIDDEEDWKRAEIQWAMLHKT